jgi:transcriptional regulator with XRE-family HTH domain
VDNATKTLNRQIGKRLHDARVLRGLTQEQLADRVGLSYQQIQKYENGSNAIAPAMMTLCAETLGVTINYLFEKSDVELPQMTASRQKLLHLLHALHELEEQHPAMFEHLCAFIVSLAEAKNG